MKKIKLSLLAALFVLLAGTTVPEKTSAQFTVNFQFFYDNLGPYGSWVNYPGYGYAWAPNVGVDFRPYVTGGHWVYSTEGWLWVSNYNWGWAPFHYGSWLYDPYYGWLWMPGYQWAPAWVTWGSYDGYYGWAPVGPGFSISIGYYPPISHWCFIEPRYMTMNDWGNHYYVAHNNQIIINNTIIINNERRISSVNNTGDYAGRAYYAGPRREEVQRYSNARISPVSLRESSVPARMQQSGNTVSIYRPQVQTETRATSRPQNVVPAEQLRSSQGAGRTGSMPLQRSVELTKPDRKTNYDRAVTPDSKHQPDMHIQRGQPLERERTVSPQRSNEMPVQQQRQAVPDLQQQHSEPAPQRDRQVIPTDRELQRGAPQRQEQPRVAPAERQQQPGKAASPEQHREAPQQRQEQRSSMPAERPKQQSHSSTADQPRTGVRQQSNSQQHIEMSSAIRQQQQQLPQQKAAAAFPGQQRQGNSNGRR